MISAHRRMELKKLGVTFGDSEVFFEHNGVRFRCEACILTHSFVSGFQFFSKRKQRWFHANDKDALKMGISYLRESLS